MTEVKLRITGEVIARHILRLPQDASLTAAMVVDGDLVLGVDMPIVPEGADTMLPIYTRRTGLPDPVALTGMDWYREGKLLP